MSENPITPEKIRGRVEAIGTFARSTQAYTLRGALMMALKELSAAADEIERLQGPPRVTGMAEMDEGGEVTPIMVDTPNGPKPISEMKDGDVYEGGIWSIEP